MNPDNPQQKTPLTLEEQYYALMHRDAASMRESDPERNAVLSPSSSLSLPNSDAVVAPPPEPSSAKTTSTPAAAGDAQEDAAPATPEVAEVHKALALLRRASAGVTADAEYFNDDACYTTVSRLTTAVAAIDSAVAGVVASLQQQQLLTSSLQTAYNKSCEARAASTTKESSMERVIVTLQTEIERLEGMCTFKMLDEVATQTDAVEGYTKGSPVGPAHQASHPPEQPRKRRRAKVNPKHPIFLKLNCVGCRTPMTTDRWESLPMDVRRKLGEMQFEVDDFVREQQNEVRDTILPRECGFCADKGDIAAVTEWGFPETVEKKKTKEEEEEELLMRILLQKSDEFLGSELAAVAAALALVAIGNNDAIATHEEHLRYLPPDVAAMVVLNRWRELGDAVDVTVTKKKKQKLGLKLDPEMKVIGFVDDKAPAKTGAAPEIPMNWFLLAHDGTMVTKMDSALSSALRAAETTCLTFAKYQIAEDVQTQLHAILLRKDASRPESGADQAAEPRTPTPVQDSVDKDAPPDPEPEPASRTPLATFFPPSPSSSASSEPAAVAAVVDISAPAPPPPTPDVAPPAAPSQTSTSTGDKEWEDVAPKAQRRKDEASDDDDAEVVDDPLAFPAASPPQPSPPPSPQPSLQQTPDVEAPEPGLPDVASSEPAAKPPSVVEAEIPRATQEHDDVASEASTAHTTSTTAFSKTSSVAAASGWFARMLKRDEQKKATPKQPKRPASIVPESVDAFPDFAD
eukprot:Rhum_TRINITY_DN20821_c0_g1::Rhum_TRINITY_DN20821_c0_g1_i1::g.172309::m.172309